jgi:hypothetical protein
MDSMTLDFAKANKDPVTECIYKEPVQLSACNHKVEGVFLKYLHSIENFTCPREGCDASSREFILLLMLQKNIQNWLERNPNAFPDNHRKLQEFIDKKSNEHALLELIKKYQDSRNLEPQIAPRPIQPNLEGTVFHKILALYFLSIVIASIYFSIYAEV